MVEVRYHCPRCETVVALERDAYLADKSVTPFPLAGWTYAEPGDEYENADGVRLVCGQDTAADDGCGEPFYLNFVRYEDGSEVPTHSEPEPVKLAGDRPTRPEAPGSPW